MLDLIEFLIDIHRISIFNYLQLLMRIMRYHFSNIVLSRIADIKKTQTIVNIHAIFLYIFQAMTQISICFCYIHFLVFLELEGHEGVLQFVVGHY